MLDYIQNVLVMVDCIVLPQSCNSSIVFTKHSLRTGREYRKFQNFKIQKIYF